MVEIYLTEDSRHQFKIKYSLAIETATIILSKLSKTQLWW